MRRTVNSTPPSVLRAVFPEAAASPASRPGRLALQPLPARWHHGRAQSDRDPALWPPFSRHLSPDPRGLLREGLPLVPTTRSLLDLCGPWARGGSLEKHLQTDTLCPNPRGSLRLCSGGTGRSCSPSWGSLSGLSLEREESQCRGGQAWAVFNRYSVV